MHFHRWEEVKKDFIYKYEICKGCGKRRAIKLFIGGYTHPDTHWLRTGEWLEPVPPKNFRSAVTHPKE